MQGIIVDSVTEQSLQTFTVGHADALEVFRRFVRADGRRAGLGDAPAGVCRIASAAVDDLLPVDTAGLVQVEAGAAISLGPGGVAPVKATFPGSWPGIGRPAYSGRANTKRLLPTLGRSSGVRPERRAPVLAATYCRPSTA